MDITNFFTVETSELSKSDRKIMKRMTSDLTNVESLTINHLAEEAGTSLASVQRFCQKMGYSGFKEFKFQLLTYIKKQESQEAAVSSSEYLDDYHDAINRVWTANEKDAEELAEVLATSSTNFIFGIYYSELPARLLSTKVPRPAKRDASGAPPGRKASAPLASVSVSVWMLSMGTLWRTLASPSITAPITRCVGESGVTRPG